MGQREPVLYSERPRHLPDYSCGHGRYRLFSLLAIIMLALSILGKLMSPTSWVGSEKPRSKNAVPLTAAEVTDEDVDTRLVSAADPRNQDGHEPIVTTQPGQDLPELDGQDEQAVALQRATAERWSRLRNGLSAQEKLLLQKVLMASRGGPVISEEDRQAWPSVLHQLDSLWNSSSVEARAALDELPDQERTAWSSALEQLDAAWMRLKPVLTAVGQGSPISDRDRGELSDVQRVLDALAWSAVRDNTVMRAAEGDAWFRCFETLQTSEVQVLQSAAVGRVGFLQLFKQPSEYRGRLVTIRGVARLGYHVEAPSNIHGIPGYYVYWVKPAGGPHRPFVVYALEIPPGFPTLKDKDRDRQTTELEEDVEFTGYFFKNWAYQAQDQTRVAPLILAKAPAWQPVERPSAQLPSAAKAIPVVLAAAAVAVALAVFVYRRSRQASASTIRQFDSTRLHDDASSEVLDALQRLAQQQDASQSPNQRG